MLCLLRPSRLAPGRLPYRVLETASRRPLDDGLRGVRDDLPLVVLAHAHPCGPRLVVGGGGVVDDEALARLRRVLDRFSAVHEPSVPEEDVAALARERARLEALLSDRVLQ